MSFILNYTALFQIMRLLWVVMEVLFTVMLLDINKGVELLIYTIKHHLLV